MKDIDINGMYLIKQHELIPHNLKGSYRGSVFIPSIADSKIVIRHEGKWIRVNGNPSCDVNLIVKGKFVHIHSIPQALAHIKNVLSFKEKQHNPNSWERKIKKIKTIMVEKCHLMEGNLFPIGFLNRVVSKLKTLGFEYKVLSKTPIELPDPTKLYFSTEQSNVEGLTNGQQTFYLRKYQKLAVYRALKNKHGIINAATNAGKTLIAAFTILNSSIKNRENALLIVPTQEIFTQSIEVFQLIFGEDKVGWLGNGKEKFAQIMVCTLQTVIKREVINNVSTIIVDEVHKFVNKSGKKLKKMYKNAMFIGMSGTPFEAGKLKTGDIIAMFGDEIYAITNKELKDKGISAQGEIIFINIDFKFDYSLDLKERLTEDPNEYYMEKEFEAIVTNKFRNDIIASQATSAMHKNEQLIIMVNRIEHGDVLKKVVVDSSSFFLQPEQIQFLQGSTKIKERKEIIDKFKSGEIKCLIVTNIFEVGVSIDEIDTIINAGGGKSSTRSLQKLGRILRQRSGKFFKYYDTMDMFAGPFVNHSKTRYSKFRSQKAWKVSLTHPLETYHHHSPKI